MHGLDPYWHEILFLLQPGSTTIQWTCISYRYIAAMTHMCYANAHGELVEGPTHDGKYIVSANALGIPNPYAAAYQAAVDVLQSDFERINPCGYRMHEDIKREKQIAKKYLEQYAWEIHAAVQAFGTISK